MKTIKIKSCKLCPHFSPFPAEYYDGECSAKNIHTEQMDTRITNEDGIPKWCPLS